MTNIAKTWEEVQIGDDLHDCEDTLPELEYFGEVQWKGTSVDLLSKDCPLTEDQLYYSLEENSFTLEELKDGSLDDCLWVISDELGLIEYGVEGSAVVYKDE